MKRPTSKVAAHTLVELMIAVAVLGVIAAMLIPGFMRSRQHAVKQLCLQKQHAIQQAVLIYEADVSTNLFEIQDDGAEIRDALLSAGHIKTITAFHCPASHTKNYADYTLAYSNDVFLGTQCTVLPKEHFLP
jgi:type II secretory pathway pseudopilin PulG